MTRKHILSLVAWTIPVIALFCSLPLVAADEQSTDGAEAGQRLAALLRSQRPENGEWKGTLKIRSHDRKTMVTVPVLGKVTADEPKWRVSYLASATAGKGAEQLTVIHSTNGPNEYLYAQAPSPGAPLGEPRHLRGAEADIPLAGSDFWLSDLGFEFYHWPLQTKLRTEMRRGRVCYVLESANPSPDHHGYSRVDTWIDRESLEQNSGGPIQAEAYDWNNKLVKEFSLGSFKKVNGHWELKEMEISNCVMGTRTRLEFDLDAK
jgi:hypothetical protein